MQGQKKREQKQTRTVYVQVLYRVRKKKCYSHIVLQREWDQFDQPGWLVLQHNI
jgi:hypothetical protein